MDKATIINAAIILHTYLNIFFLNKGEVRETVSVNIN